ncbi:MAG: elongation factor P [Bdellovibrionales bacterium RBG_16_40_8]|nr:MAG: elongation factor P [Bdellovibrionales bacterium RBG_16_40_8]
MHETSDFRKGLHLLIDGDPYVIVDFQHVKPGKGNQFTRTKLRNLVTGQNLERTIKSGEKFPAADIAFRDMNFLYKEDTGYVFMDPSDYEQITLSTDVVGDGRYYLLENLQVKICFFNERAVGLDFPVSVNLKVMQTDPGFKGNTVTGTFKPATLETGLVVQVPLHTNEGDVLKIDTRTGEYKERVSIR